MRLLLAEEILLLTLEDTSWTAQSTHAGALVGGALLAELTLEETVRLEEKQGWLHRPKVLVRPGAAGPADPLLAEAWRTVAEQPRTPRRLVMHLGAGRRALLHQRLAERGILAPPEDGRRRFFGVRPSTVLDPRPGQELRARLEDCLVLGRRPDPRTATLVALLDAVNRAHRVVDRRGLSSRQVGKRATSISQGDWVARAVRDAVAAQASADVSVGDSGDGGGGD